MWTNEKYSDKFCLPLPFKLFLSPTAILTYNLYIRVIHFRTANDQSIRKC